MSESYIGQITLFAGAYAPVGWQDCSGQLLPINQNQALYAILGTNYGGNGTTTFALPDLRGRVAIHTGQGPGLSNYTLGQNGGSETVTLLATQLPAHVHTTTAAAQPATSAGAGSPTPGGNILGSPVDATGAGFNLYAPAGTTPATPMVAPPIQVAGGSQPHANMQPILTMRYIICVSGLFPSRN